MRSIILISLLISLSVYGQESSYKLDVIAAYSLAQKELDLGHIENAYSLFESCIAKDSSCVEAYLSLSIIDFDRGAYEKSLSFAEKSKRINPFNPTVNRQLGKAYYALDNHADAYTFLKRSVSLDNESTEGYYYLAQACQKLDNYDDAKYYFEKALNLNPDDEKIWNSRGVLHIETEEFLKAKNDFLFASKLNPASVSITINLIHVLFKMDETNAALDLMAETFPLANNNEKSNLYTLQGYHYLEANNLSSADSCFRLATTLDYSQASALIGQAAINIKQENFLSAIENCNAAITIEPTIASAYLNRGIANEMIRKTDLACIDWEKAFFLGSTKAIDYLNSPVCNE